MTQETAHEDAKGELVKRLIDCLYDNRHGSLESAIAKALEGFNVTKKD